MKPKALMVVLFIVTFIVSFALYLILVTFITPLLDLSGSAKKQLEVAPEVNTTGLTNEQLIKLHDAKIPGDDSYGSSNQSSSVNTNSQTKTPDNDVTNPQPANIDDNTSDKVNTTQDNTTNKPAKTDDKTLEPINQTSKPVDSKPIIDQPNTNNSDKPILDRSLDQKPLNTGSVPKPANKVMIGSYSSLEEAKKASDSIAGSNMNVTPVIKQVNGKYSVQVGAFSDKKRAENLATRLNANNYDASIKNE